jgi:hypothetical protein
VPAAGELPGDGLHGVHVAVTVDDEVRLVIAEDNRVVGFGGLPATLDHQRPQ